MKKTDIMKAMTVVLALLAVSFQGAAQWRDCGTAEFTDGWLCPQYMPDEPDTWTVNVQQNAETPTIYRLVSPYTAVGCPLPDYGYTGYIELNVADPDCVTVTPGIFCGFKNGTMTFYCFNEEGRLAAKGLSSAQIKAELGANYKYSTLNDNTVTIGRCVLSTDEACEKGLQWNSPEVAAKMIARIRFNQLVTSVGTIAAEKAGVEYFNLQGMRVDVPEAGSLLIRRCGGKVEKVIVR